MSADPVSVSLVLPPALADTALQLLEDAEYAKLALLAAEIHDVRTGAAALLAKPLSAPIEAHRLNDLLGRSVKAGKELELMRKARVEPLNREVRNVNALFGAATEVLDRFRQGCERHLIAWKRQEEARIAREREEVRLRQEEAARKEAEAMAASDLVAAEAASREQTAAQLAEPPPAPKAYKSEEATSFARERWVVEVIQPGLVPAAYCSPDLKKIRAAVAAGARDIPGVAISLEESLTVRTR